MEKGPLFAQNDPPPPTTNPGYGPVAECQSHAENDHCPELVPQGRMTAARHRPNVSDVGVTFCQRLSSNHLVLAGVERHVEAKHISNTS